jgi:rare lipoprotein A
VLQVGTASYYGSGFHGGRTANGERFNQNDLTCAHNGLPFGCKIRVTNLRNNKSVDVRVNDRGGFAKHGRVIDLSKAAAGKIGMLGSGTAKVKIQVVH